MCVILCCICMGSLQATMTAIQEDLDKQHFVRYTTKLVTFGLTWTIEDMQSLCGESMCDFPLLQSEPFKSPPPKQITDSNKQQPACFDLWLYPKGADASNAGFIGLFLNMLSTGNLLDTVPCKYWFWLVDAKNEKRLLFSGFNLFKSIASNWGRHQAINCADLLDPAKGFLQDSHKLVIHCKVSIYKCGSSDEPKRVVPALSEQQLVDKLTVGRVSSWDKSIADMLDSGVHSDVTLVLVDDGGKEIRAHKFILAARSPVFADMFSSHLGAQWSWWSRSTNRVEIAKTRVEVFKQMLHFIYTGKVSSLDGIAKDLLICADKYQLDSLKAICEQYLVATASESNLSDLAILSNVPKVKVLDSTRNPIDAQLSDAEKVLLGGSILV